MLRAVLPNGFSPDAISQVTILAVTNTAVDEWNDIISALNDNVEVITNSKDWFSEVDDPNNNLRNMLNEAGLNQFDKAGIPPHELKLKVGDICFIVRNLNVDEGIANSSRCQIITITERLLTVKLLNGNNEIVALPKIRFSFRVNRGQSFEMVREQFPVRRAYAITFNKSQGQTLEKVILDLRSNLFAHGYLYVGLSRVFDCNNMYLYARKEDLYYSNHQHEAHINHGCIINNIVFKDILDFLDSVY